MTHFNLREQVNQTLLSFHGGDPYGDIILSAEKHRLEHGPECGLFPAGPSVMRLVSNLVRM